MEAQRESPLHAMEQSGLEHLSRPGRLDCTTEVVAKGGPGGGSAEGNGCPRPSSSSSSSLESRSLNGDGGGKRQRRRKRTSRSGTGGRTLETWAGLRAESVWFEHGVYERAESAYQVWLAGLVDGAGGVAPEEGGCPAPAQPPLLPVNCRHGDQVACHHLVQAVWVNKSAFESAERLFMEQAVAVPAAPGSLAIPPSREDPPAPADARETPSDEGYLSLTPTPATPLALPHPRRESVNGLPGLPTELLRGVWVEKPRYDRAEAAYYQSLCSQLALPSEAGGAAPSVPPPAATPPTVPFTTVTPPTPTVVTSPSALPNIMTLPTPTVVTNPCALPAMLTPPTTTVFTDASVLPAVLTTPTETAPTPGDVPAGEAEQDSLCYFLHPDSERVWLEAPRFHAAERLFHETAAVITATETLALADSAERCPSPEPSLEGDLPTPSMPCPDTMTGVEYLAQEKIWFDKCRYDEAERRFYERMNGPTQSPQETGANTILQDIARARENIQKSLAGMKTSLQHGKGRSRTPQNRRGQPGAAGGAGDQSELASRMKSLELENQSLHKVVEELRSALSKLESRVAFLEKRPAAAAAPAPAPACAKVAPAPQPKVRAPVEEDDDDDLDLFGSDEEDDAEAERIKEQRVKEYAERKAKKPALIAKSSILLDVKPWDDETDMVKLEECVRSVQADGLLWGSSKLVPVGYGIKKLQIQCVVEDDKVGTDMLEEEITKFEDYVQSVDVAAFNKI